MSNLSLFKLTWFKNNKLTSFSLLSTFTLLFVVFIHPRVVTKTETVIKTITVEKKVVQYVDRVKFVNRVRTITITKKDGTKIVEQDKTQSETQSETQRETLEKRQSDTKSVTQIVASKSRYHVAVLGVFSPFSVTGFTPAAQVTVGARLGDLPFFVDLDMLPQKQEFGLGLSYEF